MQAKVGAARSRDRPKARVAAFEAALTDRVHLGADNYGPVVGRTTRAMGDGRTLKQTSEVPCCDVMVAHLRVWQHVSIDNPVYGRYSTAVHIS